MKGAAMVGLPSPTLPNLLSVTFYFLCLSSLRISSGFYCEKETESPHGPILEVSSPAAPECRFCLDLAEERERLGEARATQASSSRAKSLKVNASVRKMIID